MKEISNYSITDEEFFNILAEIIAGEPAQGILLIPGVYEPLSEHFNNEILAIWKKRQQEENTDE